MRVHKTYRYRLEPNSEQRQLFARFAGSCRFIYNRALAIRKTTYEQCKKSVSYAEQCKQLTAWKQAEQTLWLQDVHSQVLQQAIKDLDAAYQHFFVECRRGRHQAFPDLRKKAKKTAFAILRASNCLKVKYFSPRLAG
jgi:putative transposase